MGSISDQIGLVLDPRPKFFLSPTGSDTSGDGSKSNPWKTPAKAYQSTPLDRECLVFLRGGTHRQIEVSNLRGRSAMVTFRPYPSEAAAVVIAWDGTGQRASVYIRNSTWVTVEGFRALVDGAYIIYGPKHIRLRDFEMSGMGIKVQGAGGGITETGEDIAIEDFAIHDIDPGSSAPAGYGIQGGIEGALSIRRGSIERIVGSGTLGGDAIQLGSSTGTYLYEDVTVGDVRAVWDTATSPPHPDHIQLQGGSHTIRRCLTYFDAITDPSQHEGQGLIASTPCSLLRIENSIFSGPPQQIVAQWSAETYHEIVNSVFLANGATGGYAALSVRAVAGITPAGYIANSIIDRLGECVTPNRAGNLIGNASAAIAGETVGMPTFVNPDGHDYRLADTSAGRGIAVESLGSLSMPLLDRALRRRAGGRVGAYTA